MKDVRFLDPPGNNTFHNARGNTKRALDRNLLYNVGSWTVFATSLAAKCKEIKQLKDKSWAS